MQIGASILAAHVVHPFSRRLRNKQKATSSPQRDHNHGSFQDQDVDIAVAARHDWLASIDHGDLSEHLVRTVALDAVADSGQ